MRHCTICGKETVDGKMKRVRKGPAQYVCHKCAEECDNRQIVGFFLAVIVVVVFFAFAIASAAN